MLSVGVSPAEMELFLESENEWLVVLGSYSPAFAYNPRCAPGYFALSGLGTRVCASCNPTNEILFEPPSPG